MGYLGTGGTGGTGWRTGPLYENFRSPDPTHWSRRWHDEALHTPSDCASRNAAEIKCNI